jgi:hypothetical protein
MAATKAQLVFDMAANLQMIVLPDGDGELDDPAFNPVGTICVRVPLADYHSSAAPVDVLQLALGPVMAADQDVGQLLQQKIQDLNNQGQGGGP